MKSKKTAKPPDASPDWTYWLGLGTRFVVSIGLGLWAGSWLDKRLGSSMPLLIWIVPLVLIAVTLFRVVQQTSRRNDGNKDPEA